MPGECRERRRALGRRILPAHRYIRCAAPVSFLPELPMSVRVRSGLIILCFLAPLWIAAQPMQNRLMIATSKDGLTFTKLHRVAYDSADVPDAVPAPGGGVLLYFQGNQFPRQDIITVGRSDNGIDGWRFQPAGIIGIGGWRVRPCDPDVLYRNGQFRLYFTGDPTDDHVPETYSAVSTDGLTFTLEDGVRFSGGAKPALDPSLLWTGDTVHYFAGGGSANMNWHAVSTDGIAFTPLPDFGINGMMMSNGLHTANGYRFYGFTNQGPRTIVSISSHDGWHWTADTGTRLQVDVSSPFEGLYVKDPAVIRTDTGYIMYYVTRKPEFSGVELREGVMPSAVRLFQSYPNPASAATTLPFDLLQTGHVRMTLRDVLGRELAVLIDGPLTAGGYAQQFDAGALPSGKYFVVLQAGAAASVIGLVVRR
jgi:predicted GH43/DUF377 family glycosyl hydrolase